jgi:hypothetical protein
MFTFRDGSTYEGFWHRGKKHGVGIFRPAAAPAASAMGSLKGAIFTYQFSVVPSSCDTLGMLSDPVHN